MSATRVDPFRGYKFRVELDNTSVASFRECGGLTATTDSVDYREGKDTPLSVRKLPGLRKFTNITLKRGLTTNQELWKWYKNILNGVTDRRNGATVLQTNHHNNFLRWTSTTASSS